MKGVIFQPSQQVHLEENMSNLTSASGEASGSSGNRNNDVGNGNLYPPTQSEPPLKKKRNLPGNPDPDAEVISLSPKTLMARNRFLCEICNKGFQRDQNLQLHRRGHNLPWKLKQRNKDEIVRKKVYVCPESSCVHHDPSRALGDLTGIKKHFCRKHGEKKWKCEKCSKRYAVQSDWKAHSKTCGTREYKCDCGTLFSRRDSFITHRAFCDALAEESARATLGNPNPIFSTHQPPLSSSTFSPINNLQVQPSFLDNNNNNNNIIQSFSLKKEPHTFGLIRPEFPQWLTNCPPPAPQPQNESNLNSLSIFSTRLDQDLAPNPNPNLGTTLQPFHSIPTASPFTSATALLQKAAQMGATMSGTNNTTSNAGGFGLNLSSRDEYDGGFINNFELYSNKNAETKNDGVAVNGGSGGPPPPQPPPPQSSILQDMMMGSFNSASGFEGSSFEDCFRGFLEQNKKDNQESNMMHGAMSRSGENQETRDFLGLGPFSQNDIFNIAGFGSCMNTSSSNEQQSETQKPWQG